jgi:hypothetical protein
VLGAILLSLDKSEGDSPLWSKLVSNRGLENDERAAVLSVLVLPGPGETVDVVESPIATP